MASNQRIKLNARNLRNNATKEENTLWYQYLRGYLVQWNRQMVVGDYILDFYCRTLKLAIEIDGSQHYEEAQMKRDKERTEFLSGLGIEVIRFTNTDINRRLAGVCEAIDQKVAEIQNRVK